jgi:hypothetical protein
LQVEQAAELKVFEEKIEILRCREMELVDQAIAHQLKSSELKSQILALQSQIILLKSNASKVKKIRWLMLLFAIMCWFIAPGSFPIVRASLVDGVNLDVYISIYTSIYTLLNLHVPSFSVERVNYDVYIPTAIFSNGYISNGYIFNGYISDLYKPPLPLLFQHTSSCDFSSHLDFICKQSTNAHRN